MEYPAEIYIFTATGEEIKHPAYRAAREKIYDLGKASVESLDGWSSLTKAISEGADIDWEKLDQRPAKCVHPELGSLTDKLRRSPGEIIENPYWWTRKRIMPGWDESLIHAWYGKYGWSLWIKGEIPLKRKTADQLPAGMCFEGKRAGDERPYTSVVLNFIDGKGVIRVYGAGLHDAEEVEVVKEYGIGTFKETA